MAPCGVYCILILQESQSKKRKVSRVDVFMDCPNALNMIQAF